MALGTSDSGITAPMNLNAVIAHLVKMSPEQRGQFASMHSDDPMMLSAAKYVDNQIKNQAKSMMAQQTGAPPPVNQQVVQQMAPPRPQPVTQQQTQQPQQQAQGLPEASGIGALPAANMQGMAGGGIVAFADGGMNDTDQDIYNAEGILVSGPSLDAYGSDDRTIMERLGVFNPENRRAVEQIGRKAPPVVRPSVATMPTDSTRVPGMVNDPRMNPTVNKALSGPSGVSGGPYVPPGAGASGAGASGAGAPGAGSPGAGSARMPTGAGPMPAGGLQKMYEGFLPKDVQDPYAAQGAEMASRTREADERDLAAAQARKEGLAGLLAPREERIKGREDRLKKTDDENLNMSLINAGLAMMQSKGQGLAGIAEGAGVGVKQYMEGKKLSEAARQKIEDARDAFDELKFNQTNMSDKEINASKRAISEGANAAQRASIQNIKDERNVGVKQAEKIFEATVRQQDAAADRASRERTAAFSAQVQKEIAQMPGAQERLFKSLGGGDAKKGFDYYTAQTAEGKGDQALILAAMKDPMVLQGLSPEVQQMVNQRIKMQMVPGMVSGTPAAGQVLTR